MQTSIAARTLAAGAGGYLTIDLNALTENYRQLSARAENAVTGAVVKADAYGLGVIPVSSALYAAGCRHFFVAHAREAFELRPRLPADAALYVLNGLTEGCEIACADQDITPVLNSPHQIARWAELAKARGIRLPAIVQFDTGMARLGLSPDETRALIDEPAPLALLDVTFLMSHLACADTPEIAANAAQMAHMREVSALFPGIPITFANSGGIFMGDGFLQALTRPGIALYGGA
ncbi:MAG TPA: alanine racemase, partial [Asticcacaulis sp.]|nr:alanine racemase [Asticcacaulis sp.]